MVLFWYASIAKLFNTFYSIVFIPFSPSNLYLWPGLYEIVVIIPSSWTRSHTWIEFKEVLLRYNFLHYKWVQLIWINLIQLKTFFFLIKTIFFSVDISLPYTSVSDKNIQSISFITRQFNYCISYPIYIIYIYSRTLSISSTPSISNRFSPFVCYIHATWWSWLIDT